MRSLPLERKLGGWEHVSVFLRVQGWLLGSKRRQLQRLRCGQVRARTSERIGDLLWHMRMLSILRGVVGHGI